jgi:tetratricopeptide (TPR) repeat protein
MKLLPIMLLCGLGIVLAATAAPNPTRTTTNKAAAVAASNLAARVDLQLDMAYKALEQGKPAIAKGLFEKALVLDPLNRRGRFGLSTALLQCDQYREALDILEQMLKEMPKDYEIKNNTAWIYATARDVKIRNGRRAVQLAQEALMLNPNDCHVESTLAEAYFISGRYDKALRHAEQALQMGRQGNVNANLIEQYQIQVDRCRKSAESSSILE